MNKCGENLEARYKGLKNKMGLSDITKFIGTMDKYNGPARNQNFYVQFTSPPGLGFNMVDLSFQTMGSSIPGTTFEVATYKAYGPNKPIPTRRNYETAQFVIYCTNTFYEKPLFDAWMELINPRAAGWDFAYKDDYTVDMNVIQLDQTNKIVYTAQYQNAFPIAVEPMPLSWESDDIHTLSVIFAYDKYLNT